MSTYANARCTKLARLWQYALQLLVPITHVDLIFADTAFCCIWCITVCCRYFGVELSRLAGLLFTNWTIDVISVLGFLCKSALLIGENRVRFVSFCLRFWNDLSILIDTFNPGISIQTRPLSSITETILSSYSKTRFYLLFIKNTAIFALVCIAMVLFLQCLANFYCFEQHLRALKWWVSVPFQTTVADLLYTRNYWGFNPH